MKGGTAQNCTSDARLAHVKINITLIGSIRSFNCQELMEVAYVVYFHDILWGYPQESMCTEHVVTVYRTLSAYELIEPETFEKVFRKYGHKIAQRFAQFVTKDAYSGEDFPARHIAIANPFLSIRKIPHSLIEFEFPVGMAGRVWTVLRSGDKAAADTSIRYFALTMNE